MMEHLLGKDWAQATLICHIVRHRVERSVRGHLDASFWIVSWVSRASFIISSISSSRPSPNHFVTFDGRNEVGAPIDALDQRDDSWRHRGGVRHVLVPGKVQRGIADELGGRNLMACGRRFDFIPLGIGEPDRPWRTCVSLFFVWNRASFIIGLLIFTHRFVSLVGGFCSETVRFRQETEAATSSATSIQCMSVQHTRPSQLRHERMPVVCRSVSESNTIRALVPYTGAAYACPNNTQTVCVGISAANRTTSARYIAMAPAVRGV